ncbi:MAG: sortase [Actinomycetota bacterium]|nr:sortase [Actinomycetota bacterium]
MATTVAVGLLFAVGGCSQSTGPASTAAGTSVDQDGTAGVASTSPSSTAQPAPTSQPAVPSQSSAPATSSPPNPVAAVPAGEIVEFRVQHGDTALIEATASGLAKYRTSANCEVPGQPCYAAPSLSAVARIDVGAEPQTPGSQTTFVTGHSNRYAPDDSGRGIFSKLQDTQIGDAVVVTTTKGRFVYAVAQVLEVPFDKLTSTDAVTHVRANTLVAISCTIAPDHGSYLGNFVVIASLQSATPL